MNYQKCTRIETSMLCNIASMQSARCKSQSLLLCVRSVFVSWIVLECAILRVSGQQATTITTTKVVLCVSSIWTFDSVDNCICWYMVHYYFVKHARYVWNDNNVLPCSAIHSTRNHGHFASTLQRFPRHPSSNMAPKHDPRYRSVLDPPIFRLNAR